MGLAWKVSPDVEQYDEAREWFRKRVVITAAEARKLDDHLKVDAFWVGGGLQLTQIQRVFDHIDGAIETGEGLEDFKKRVGGLLRDPHHVETVFRNATQRSYNAGRWHQMREPSTAKFRPFWLYDAVLDDRTTDICRECGGTLLPYDHPFWKTHIPPLHHRCRASIRNLRRSEAEKRGITQVPPGDKGTPKPGWGHEPSRDPKPWKPEAAKHDKQLLLDFGDREDKGVKARKPKVPPPAPKEEPKLDLATWVPHYEPRYGVDAAKSVGRGRAALEIGLDLPVGEVRKQLGKLDSPGSRAMLEACEDCDADRTLREQAGELDPLRKAAAGLAGHLRTLPKRGAIKNRSLALKPEGKAALEYFTKVTGPEAVQWPAEMKALPIKGKNGSYFDPTEASPKVVYTTRVGALHHELAHAIEEYGPELFTRAEAFLLKRAEGFELVDRGGRNGLCWKDEFYETYTGRRYPKNIAEKSVDPKAPIRATETLSTAVELLFANETFWGTLEDWVRADPDHFFFMLGQLAGK